jgi:hypothetical protein
MGIALYLGGCSACGAALAWVRARGLPFAIVTDTTVATEER